MKINKEGVALWMDHGVDLTNRVLYIGGDTTSDDGSGEPDLGHQTSKLFIQSMHLLRNGPRAEEAIRIILNNPGGHISEGFAIYDTIMEARTAGCRVVIEVRGQASSMAAIVLQAADERVAHDHALILVHDGSYSYDGTPRDFEQQAKYCKQIRKRTYAILGQRTHLDVKWWKKYGGVEHSYSADEALEIGLIDTIVYAKVFPKKTDKVSRRKK